LFVGGLLQDVTISKIKISMMDLFIEVLPESLIFQFSDIMLSCNQ